MGDPDAEVLAAARTHMMHRGGSTIRQEDVRHAERVLDRLLTVSPK